MIESLEGALLIVPILDDGNQVILSILVVQVPVVEVLSAPDVEVTLLGPQVGVHHRLPQERLSCEHGP